MLVRLIMGVLSLLPFWTMDAIGQEKIGQCDKDGYEIQLTTVDGAISGSNAAESYIAAGAASATVQLTSISPGPVRKDETCTRIKWRGQGGCIKASALLMRPQLQNQDVDACSDYSQTMEALRETAIRNVRDRVSKFRQTLGQCATEAEHQKRLALARASAITGETSSNARLQAQFDNFLEIGAQRVESCIPKITVKEYGSRAYYQFDEDVQASCAATSDPQMLGVSIYAPAEPVMSPVKVTISGGDGVMFLAQTSVTATLPGQIGSIPGQAICEPRALDGYTTQHAFILLASEPVYWNRSNSPVRQHVAVLTRKCGRGRCD